MRIVLPAAAVAAAAGIALSVYGTTLPKYVQPPTPSASQGVTTAQPADPIVIHDIGAVQLRGARVTTRVKHDIVASRPKHSGVSAPERSAPVRIAVAAIGVSSQFGPARGLKPNGTLDDAPLSGPVWSLPWWYSAGPAPGQSGSAVILGHVDSALGAGHLGAFFKLGDLRPGELITVTLADGLTTRWLVTSARLYIDGAFPNSAVYDLNGPPTLRLVTCGGNFDWHTHEYDSATVVSARPA